MANFDEEAHKKGASRAINKFVDDLWKTFPLDKIESKGPKGETPRERKKNTIKTLELLIQDMAFNGAKIGASQILAMQRKAGFTYRTKGVVFKNWKRAVSKKISRVVTS